MASHPTPTIDEILKSCVTSAPRPWRPSEYARSAGVERDSLDEPLNRLRLAGLVRLTDWEPGIGQGYLPTEAGTAVAANAGSLERLRNGATPAPAPANRALRRTSDAYRRGEQIRVAVFEPHSAPVNRTMIGAQVVVFAVGLYLALTHKIPLAEYLKTGRSPIFEYLAVSPPHLARGDWWVLLTSAFVHVGGIHLMVNLFSMAALGPTVEGMLGSGRYLGLWLISALGGSVCVAALGQSAAGSSGVICGLIGAQAAFVAIFHPHIGRRTTARFREWLIKTLVVVVVISLIPWVSWAAHLGGGVAGALAGGLLAIQRFGRPAWRGPALLGVVAIPVCCVAYLTSQGILGSARTERQIAAHESADFTDRLRPIIEQVENSSRSIEDDLVAPLRSLRPESRPPDRTEAALGALKKLRTDAANALLTVMQTGRYHTPAVEQVRVAGAEMLNRQAHVAQQFEECLRRGEMWTLDKDENLLQFLLNEALEAEIAYRRAANQLLNTHGQWAARPDLAAN